MILPNISIGKSDIFIVDNLTPEAVAMAQALYSRSPKSVAVHLDKIAKTGHEKFMASYYVGYGHKSIGDCGSTTLFIENVSMLAAKAIQDWKLYRGQEASTRYLDMANQEVLNPLGTSDGAVIQKKWMDFYQKVLSEMITYLSEKYPRGVDEDENTYNKAIKAKAFDVARGFLPAGATTYVSWHTDLRQAHDHLTNLSHHPLSEVSNLADGIRDGLKAKYTSSFSHKTYPEQSQYKDLLADKVYFDIPNTLLAKDSFHVDHNLDVTTLLVFEDKILKTRPVRTELPAKFEKYGSMKFTFLLDFGSFRDLQRHRNGVCEMPLLTINHGFHQWYLDQLPALLRTEATMFLTKQESQIRQLQTTDTVRQYYIGMGYNVACEVTYSLPQTVYVAELRSSQTVHSTLRVIAQKMAANLKKILPIIALHVDIGPDEWSIKRGAQDIVKKPEAPSSKKGLFPTSLHGFN